VWRLERELFLEKEKGLEIDVYGLAEKARDADWFVLVNGEDLYLETEQIREYEPEEQRTYHMFYTVDYMKSLFPRATILPPANDEMQHCCVIRG
jgi:predicted RNase H-like nuclease